MKAMQKLHELGLAARNPCSVHHSLQGDEADEKKYDDSDESDAAVNVTHHVYTRG
jgi:hypothetical protein